MSDKGYKRVVVELPAHIKSQLDEIVKRRNMTMKDFIIECVLNGFDKIRPRRG